MPDNPLKPISQVVLASSSPYRKKLLEQLLPQFICHSPDIDETPLQHESPSALVSRLAQAKAQALACRYPNALLIGSDQVAKLDDHILTKPGSFSAARRQLTSCSGRKVNFVTGLCVLRESDGYLQSIVEPFSVYFRDLTKQEIESYLHREQPYDCAGAFKAEGLGIALFNKLEGRDPNALIGLPLVALTDMLREAGVNPLLINHVSS